MTARLARAEVIPLALPFARRYVTSRGSIDHRETVLLRLTDSEGLTGLGEGVPLSLRGAGSLARSVADLDSWAAAALEAGAVDWRTAEPASSGGPIAEGLSAPARLAALTAAADLEARRRELPLWRLLGATAAEPVPCNATLVTGEPGEVAADSARWAGRGFSTFKLKVGLDRGPVGASADRDLAQVAAVREAVGPRARIRLDANASWSLPRAHEALQAAAEHGLELVEQPVAGLEQMAELRSLLDGRVPVAADEAVDSAWAARRAVDLGACDLVTVKLSKVGSLDPLLDIKLPAYLSSALDGPVGIAAAAHAYQVLRERNGVALETGPDDGERRPLAQGLATGSLLAGTIASQECELHGSELFLPGGSGLGVELDPDAVSRHATRSPSR